MGQRAQQGFEWLVVLQAAEHRSENQHDSKRRAILSQVESLKTDFADAINAKPCQYMNNVMGFLEPVNDELVWVRHRRGIDQGVGSDALIDQLIGIAASNVDDSICRRQVFALANVMVSIES